MKYLKYTALFASLLLVFGFGCSSKTPAETRVAQNDDIVSSTPMQEAYLFCTTQGYSVHIERSAESLSGHVYCQFDEARSCPAFEFLSGDCDVENADGQLPAETAAIIDESDLSISTGPRFCPSVAEPVCGEDSRTYVNDCVAELQGVEIIHEGACENPVILDDPASETDASGRKRRTVRSTNTSRKTSSGSSSSGSTSQSTDREVTPESPDWIDSLIALLRADASLSTASIDSCKAGSRTYYLQRGNFSALYDTRGQVICYPGRDVHDTCPESYRDGEFRCQEIWKK
ncbi:MAG: hypothetical protein HOE53_03930 [Candidatus Magasanikbacteria bacterium]|jgi:hypothetical protein|nr:hypothetical protein [Candidatus Magasanikbacteria bacterium]